jgi:hypothetical protein
MIHTFSTKPETEDEAFLKWLKNKLHVEYRSFSSAIIVALKEKYKAEYDKR